VEIAQNGKQLLSKKEKNKRQILQSYNTARFVQYDKIHVLNSIRRIIQIRHMTHPWLRQLKQNEKEKTDTQPHKRTRTYISTNMHEHMPVRKHTHIYTHLHTLTHIQASYLGVDGMGGGERLHSEAARQLKLIITLHRAAY
jgi:hypothetical protein